MPNVIAAAGSRWLTRPMRHVRHVSVRAPAEHDVEIPEQPMVLNEDGTRYLRKREHGNKPLPLSPLMDPILSAARLKHKQPKAGFEENHEKTQFQKDLERNVYARALATDIRACAITDTRLPKHFLIGVRSTLIGDGEGDAKSLDGALTPDLPRDKRIDLHSRSRTYLHRSGTLLAHVHASIKAQRRLVGLKGEQWLTLQRRRAQEKGEARVNAGVVRDPLFKDKVLSVMQDNVVDMLLAVPLDFYRPVDSPSDPEPGDDTAASCLLDLRPHNAGETDIDQGPEPPYHLTTLLSEAQLDTVQGYLGRELIWALSEVVETVNARLALLKLASHISSSEPTSQKPSRVSATQAEEADSEDLELGTAVEESLEAGDSREFVPLSPG